MKNTLDTITCAVKGIAATLLSVLGLLVIVQAVFGSSAPVDVIGNLQALIGGFVGPETGFTSFLTLVLVVALLAKNSSCSQSKCDKEG
jgi:hypothetical protein